MVRELASLQPCRNHQEVVKIANEATIFTKITYFGKNSEEYPIEYSTII